MKRTTLTGFEKYWKTTRRVQFLADKPVIVPSAEQTTVIEPFYPKTCEASRRPLLRLERMMRVYFLHLRFDMSDPVIEEERCKSASMSNFAGVDVGVEAAADETTVNDHLRRSGIKVTPGTIVDATMIGAPGLTKSKEGKRNPEMYQTAKDKQSYFGMKAHTEVDSRTNLLHMVLASAANVADCHALQYFLHGTEKRVGDRRIGVSRRRSDPVPPEQ